MLTSWPCKLCRLEEVMAIPKIKTEGGQGGRRGHSNMAHWMYTEEIKDAARKRRRKESKEIVRAATVSVELEGGIGDK